MPIQPSLQKVIDDWKAFEWAPNSKKVAIVTSPINPDEYMLICSIELNVNIGHQPNPIRVRSRFFTFAQHDPKVNPAGDAHNLKIVLDNLDNKFQKEIDSLISG